jgi:hypothetical protein
VESSKKAIYKAFVRDLKDKIANFENEIAEDSIKRSSTMHDRIKEFKALREEISFYSQALSFQAGDLDSSLQKLSQTLQNKLSTL